MILGLIPARSGSKGVPNKNIYPLAGYPLLAWSIAASKMSGFIEKTVVSTESPQYGDIAIQYGAEWLMRPVELATDEAGDEGYLQHALEYFPAKWIALLRPTTPLREPNDIDQALMRVRSHAEHTSLRSSFQTRESYKKFYLIYAYSESHSVFKYYTPISDKGNLPRQNFMENYHPNGYVDILKASLVRKGELYGDKIVPFITDDVGEIDRKEDFDYIEWRLEKYGSVIYDYLKANYPNP